MRLNLPATVVAVGLCLLIAGTALSAVTTATSTSYALRPCSTCKEVVYPTEAECRAAGQAEAQRVGETRTTGAAVYTCITRHNVIATFRANPVTCPPAPQPRSQACPQGYTGSWEQRATVSAPPTCTVTWSPTTAPSGACTQIPAPEATLIWQHDGLNATGFRVVYGQSVSALTNTVQVGDVRTHTIRSLPPGTYYFAVKAYNATGESDSSNVVQKVIR